MPPCSWIQTGSDQGPAGSVAVTKKLPPPDTFVVTM
jgi:hypothetical protein